MKIFTKIFMCVFLWACGTVYVPAQDIYLSIPAHNIFQRTEFNTVQNILNTNGNRKWRKLPGPDKAFSTESPAIRSVSGSSFTQAGSNISLPASVLRWQLNSIGGNTSIKGGTVPGFKWFDTNAQSWYDLNPGLLSGEDDFTAGAVAFTFKIPSLEFSENVFVSGEYSMSVAHNYSGPGLLSLSDPIIFEPASSFEVVLVIPSAISWLSYHPAKYIEVSSLDDYRTASTFYLGDPIPAGAGHTVPFNLWVGTSSSSVTFTSSKGEAGMRDVSLIRLGSKYPGLKTESLSDGPKNYSVSPFEVLPGNRQSFPLQFSLSARDFRNYFFEAGTYTFQLDLEAKSTDNTISQRQTTDVTLKVLPMSEINVSASGRSVYFDFNTPAHYQQGQSKVVPNQIRLSNNEHFELYVRSESSFFKREGISSDIKSGILEVGVDGRRSVSLSVIPQKIIFDGIPVLDQELDIRYTISGESARSLLSAERAVYSMDVIYSFTAL